MLLASLSGYPPSRLVRRSGMTAERAHSGRAGGALVVLALVSSMTSLANGFAYDDLAIIVHDDRVHHLARWWTLFAEPYWPTRWGGGGLYRPLTTTVFAIEWAVGRGSPVVFHGVNVALYVAVCLAVWALARHILQPAAAWLSAALFAVHPVHTEVVANAVGQSELLVALALTAATTLYLQRRRSGDLTSVDVATLAVLYAVGCLAKENGIVLPALLAAAELTVVTDPRPASARVRALVPAACALAAVGVAFVLVRTAVLHGAVAESPPAVLRGADWWTRLWTTLGIVPEWARLLIWPARLLALYSPPAYPARTGIDAMVLAGIVLLAAAVGLAIAARRRAPAVTFGLIWMAVALLPVSNLLVRAGLMLSERSLFVPSVGWVIVVGALAARLGTRHAATRIMVPIAACLLLLGAWRSAAREPVWHDDASLVARTLADAPRDYMAHYTAGAGLEAAGRPDEAEQEYRVALQLYGGDARPYGALGKAYYRDGHCPAATPLLRRAIDIDSTFDDARILLAACLADAGDYAAMRSVALGGIRVGKRSVTFQWLLAQSDSARARSLAGLPAHPLAIHLH
jgi:protein O-mannosyl-transferase